MSNNKQETYDNVALGVRKLKVLDGKENTDTPTMQFQVVEIPFNTTTGKTGPLKVRYSTHDRWDVMVQLEVQSEDLMENA